MKSSTTPSLLLRVVHASGWTLMAFGTTIAARFCGNLLLTRMLFPEAFGIMAIVQSVFIGIAMLSDLGVEQAIIQHPEGHSERFVNTAWSIQVLRGLSIWGASFVLAWPIASFYGQSQVGWLLPAIGFSAFVGGLASTNIVLASRNLGIAKATFVEVFATLAGVAVTLYLAWRTQSVWALVVGANASALLKTLASHYYLDGGGNRFSWDATALSSLRSFGRWIFLGTALTFLVGEGSRLLIARFVDVREVAFYSLAMSLNAFPLQIIQQIGSRVFFPAFSEISRQQPERLRSALLVSRLVQILPYWIFSLGFVWFGESIVKVLYDGRYFQVGAMLKVLALGSLPQSIIVSYGSVLLAKGNAKTTTLLLFVQLLLQVLSISVGIYLQGIQGVLIGLVVTQWLLYPFYAFTYKRAHLWQPWVDLPLLIASSAITLESFWGG